MRALHVVAQVVYCGQFDGCGDLFVQREIDGGDRHTAGKTPCDVPQSQ